MLALFGAVTVVHHIRKKQFKKIFTVPVIMIVVGVVGIGASYLVQNFVVSPDEINKEDKYLERETSNIPSMHMSLTTYLSSPLQQITN